MFTCSKKYADLPFAHRQHNHKGHCALIHGHNWAFKFTFGCTMRDANGFVVDFGDLKWLKEFLYAHFDHTLVLNIDDPALDYLKKVLIDDAPQISGEMFVKFADIILVPNCGAEGLASFLFEEVDRLLSAHTDGRVHLVSVEVLEDEKNAATYFPAPHCSHA